MLFAIKIRLFIKLEKTEITEINIILFMVDRKTEKRSKGWL